MTKLTVSMPAYNKEQYIGEAIASVLQQEQVDFELVVVDDGSQDNTLSVVKSFDDPRIKLICNSQPHGEAFCHNLAIKQSKSDFIAHVDADAVVLPGAFQKLVDTLERHPEVAQAHCYYFSTDENGKISRTGFRQERERRQHSMQTHMNYKRSLLTQGDVFNHLRTYRRDIFEDVGLFNESLRSGAAYEMALRIADKYAIRLVPEFLSATRVEDKKGWLFSQWDKWKVFAEMVGICWQLLKEGKVGFLKSQKYRVPGLLLINFYHTLPLDKLSQLKNKIIRLYQGFTWRKLMSLASNFWWNSGSGSSYQWLVERFSWWPIRLIPRQHLHNLPPEKRIAYVLWHYPILSETFIRREIAALKRSGLSVDVVADEPDNLEVMDEDVRALKNETHYIFPWDRKKFTKYFWYFLLKKNLSFLNLFIYCVFHRYGYNKSFSMDCLVFGKAVYLAGELKSKQINHIHSPWADRHAFFVLIASQLLGVPYSVQARAHDIHRKTSLYALPEKLSNAQFIVTNTSYNQLYLSKLLGKSAHDKIYQIYNGIDLEKFNPPPAKPSASRHFKIMAVGRLVEQKGFEYLLKACNIVKQRGLTFRCDIIGGVQETLDINCYIRLKKIHKDLNLEEEVFFLGVQPFSMVLQAYQEADLLVLPCVITEDGDRDIIPNVLIEAMAMKLPIVSTTVTGVPEIVDDGINGILVPPRDENALAEGIIKLIGDEELRKSYGERGRDKVEERFDINKNIEKYVKLFKGL